MGYVDALIADAQRDVRRLKEDMDSGFANTRLGRACKVAREEFRHAKAGNISFEGRHRCSQVTPPHVYQALPDIQVHPGTYLALLFFTHPSTLGVQVRQPWLKVCLVLVRAQLLPSEGTPPTAIAEC